MEALTSGLSEGHPKIKVLRAQLAILQQKSDQAGNDPTGFTAFQEAALQQKIEQVNRLKQELLETTRLKDQEISRLKDTITELEAKLNATKTE